MQKKYFFACLLLISATVCGGCGVRKPLSASEINQHEKIHSYYSKMESYSATPICHVLSNKTENIYNGIQKALGEEMFSLTLTNQENNITTTRMIRHGTAVIIADGNSQTEIPVHREYTDILFLNIFFKTYHLSQDCSVYADGDGTHTVYETALPMGNSAYRRAFLQIDNQTLAPTRLTVTDSGGKPLFWAEYHDFVYNDKTITEDIFHIGDPQT